MDLAGKAFNKAAESFLRVEQKHDASMAYENSGKSYQKVDSAEAVIMYQKSMGIVLDEGQFGLAARSAKDIAELLESEKSTDEAVKYYLLASEYFESASNNASNVAGCRLKAAHLLASAEPPQFDKAADLFENCGRDAATASTVRGHSAKEYLFKAAICRLALGDVVGTRRAADEYGTYFYDWPSSRESTFIATILSAVEDYDQDAFTAAVQDWNATSNLDAFRTGILLRIKEAIPSADEQNLL